MTNSTHFFLGANSGRGFQSLFPQFCAPEQYDDLLILKGGPGAGKSTMMKKIGAALEEEGETVEYLFCSGDPDSLDGVHIPRLRTAIVDGTAPHVAVPSGHPPEVLPAFCGGGSHSITQKRRTGSPCTYRAQDRGFPRPCALHIYRTIALIASIKSTTEDLGTRDTGSPSTTARHCSPS